MTLRLVALLLGTGVALYRHFRHYDDWQASVFYGFLAASLAHTIAGFGDGVGMDYEGLRRDR